MARGPEPGLSGPQLASPGRPTTMMPGELARHDTVQPPAMTRVIAVPEDRGLAATAPHPADRRHVVLTIPHHGGRPRELSPRQRAVLRATALIP
jgi:DNA-binding MarR family transcriptional regulator